MEVWVVTENDTSGCGSYQGTFHTIFKTEKAAKDCERKCISDIVKSNVEELQELELYQRKRHYWESLSEEDRSGFWDFLWEKGYQGIHIQKHTFELDKDLMLSLHP